MSESFEVILSSGGKTNSLGRAGEVIDSVLTDRARLEELYDCMFSEDAWVRMRAADSFEKIGREHPDWLHGYIDRLQADLSTSKQPSIQWHLAQIYKEIELSDAQRQRAIDWLEELLSTIEIDWIVAANAMQTLAHFTKTGYVEASRLHELLSIQSGHKSKSVVKRSAKIAAEFILKDSNGI